MLITRREILSNHLKGCWEASSVTVFIVTNYELMKRLSFVSWCLWHSSSLMLWIAGFIRISIGVPWLIYRLPLTLLAARHFCSVTSMTSSPPFLRSSWHGKVLLRGFSIFTLTTKGQRKIPTARPRNVRYSQKIMLFRIKRYHVPWKYLDDYQQWLSKLENRSHVLKVGLPLLLQHSKAISTINYKRLLPIPLNGRNNRQECTARYELHTINYSIWTLTSLRFYLWRVITLYSSAR